MALARYFEFVKYANLPSRTVYGQNRPIYIKISSRSVERLRRYRDFLVSNLAAVRHFKFSKYANFHFVRGLEW